MFFQLFNKITLVPKSSYSPNTRKILSIENYSSEIINYDTLNEYYQKLLQSSVAPITNGIWLIDDMDFHNFVCDYIHGLSLDYTSYQKIISYNQLHQKYNCILPSIVSKWSPFDENILSINDFNQRNLQIPLLNKDFIMAEFKINEIDQIKNSYRIYQHFYFCDILKNIFHYHMRCIVKNIKISPLLSEFYSYAQCDELFDNSLFDAIRDEMKYLNIWSDMFDHNLSTYAVLTDCMGYENYLLYKYNFPLRDYLKQINYGG